MSSPYEILGGDSGIRALANAFYDAMDSQHEAAGIRAMHGKNLDDIREKLYQYLSGWLGGPHLYKEKYGTICLTDAHAPYHIGPSERDQWLSCMDIALDKIGASEETKALMKDPMFNLADFIRTDQ